MSHVYELGSSLCKLLSTLKKNREQVPLHILKTQYKVPYEALIRQINETATAFVKEVVFSKLLMNPDEEKEEQYSVTYLHQTPPTVSSASSHSRL